VIAELIASMALASSSAAPHVVSISPAARSIPANTLRLYVIFDRPARELVATRDVRLVDADGRTVDGAFMDFGQDLWSPDGRRLTVLFDPGRVKQDVEGRGDSAAPLQAGRSFTVEVGDKRFHYQVTPALRAPIDPQAWRLSAPSAGSRGPLAVTFDRELDGALLRDQLDVVDAHGRSQSGQVTVSADGEAWSWRPDHTWRPGAYRLLVGSSLEDVSGNQVGEALDHDVGDTGRTFREFGRPFHGRAPFGTLRLWKPPWTNYETVSFEFCAIGANRARCPRLW
jgi:hypothetical protein